MKLWAWLASSGCCVSQGRDLLHSWHKNWSAFPINPPPSLTRSVGLGWVSGMAHISSVTPQSLCQDSLCPAEKHRTTFYSPHTRTHSLSFIYTPLLTQRAVVPPICIQIPLSNALCICRWMCLCVYWTCATVYSSLSCCLAETGWPPSCV